MIRKLMWINEDKDYIAFEIVIDGKHAYYEYINWQGMADAENHMPIKMVMDDIEPHEASIHRSFTKS